MVIDHGQTMFLHDYKNPLLLFVRELAVFEFPILCYACRCGWAPKIRN